MFSPLSTLLSSDFPITLDLSTSVMYCTISTQNAFKITLSFFK